MTEQTVEAEARKMGWLPKEEFRGSDDKWVDAQRYVERGKEFIPFLQADRRRLQEDLDQAKQKAAALESRLNEASEAIEALKEFRSEFTKRDAETQKTQIVEGIKEARQNGDVEAEEALRDKLSEVRQVLEKPVEPPKPSQPPAPTGVDFTQTPEWKSFIEKNSWWNTDPVMQAAAVAIGQQLNSKGELSGLTPSERFAKIAEHTKAKFRMEESQTSRNSDVEGSRGGAGDSSRSADPSWAKLPQEAKDGAAKYESRLVGPGKAYKTIGDYRQYYATEYFRRNPNG